MERRGAAARGVPMSGSQRQGGAARPCGRPDPASFRKRIAAACGVHGMAGSGAAWQGWQVSGIHPGAELRSEGSVSDPLRTFGS